jgi:hypothetical protein
MKKNLSIIYTLLVATFLINSCRKWELEKVELLPTVKTTSTKNIALTTATVGGIFEIVGSQTVDEYGHCWSETPNANIGNTRSTQTERKKVGEFSSELTNLKANTTYFVRAYAKIGNKIVYASNEINFRTLRLPSIEITESRDITANNAKILVNFTDFGSPDATVYGLCWATTPNPTIISTPNRTTINVSNMGTLQLSISNLQVNTTYYIRAYATNAAGTAYSSKDFILQTSCSLANLTLQNSVLNLQPNSATLIISSIQMNCDKLSVLELQYGEEANFSNRQKISNISNGVNFSVFLENLLPNTTYFARIYAANSGGVSLSNIISFKTPCALPVLTTQNVSNITTTTASISTVISRINCTNLINSGFSLATNSTFSNATNFPNISNSTSFNQTFTNLSPNTTYFVRSYATNLAGIAYSTTQSFTTIAILSVGVQTVNVTNITSTSATLNGNITNLGNSNSVTAGFLLSSSSQTPLLNGAGVNNIGVQTRTSTGIFSTTVSLQSGVTYYFRAYSINSLGIVSYGNILSFITVSLASVTTLEATNLTLNAANLQGSLQSLGNVATVSVGFVISTSNQNPLLNGGNVTNISSGDFSSVGNISSIINSLQQGTTYYFRIYATNSAGTNYGQVLSFTTLSLPTITTLATTNITSSTAIFNLNLTSLGSHTSVNTGFVFSSSNTTPTIGGSGVLNYGMTLTGNIGMQSMNVTNLQANTTYYVRAYTSTNTTPATIVYGQVLSFMTLTPLSVTTLPTTNITSNSATFNLNLTSLGENSSVNTGFVFSTSNTNPTIGNTSTIQFLFPNLSTNTGTQIIGFSNLQSNTTYYIRAYASTNTTPSIIVYGQVLSFMTASNCGLVNSGLISCFLFEGNLTDGTGNYSASQQNTSLIINRKNNVNSALSFGGTATNSRLSINNPTYSTNNVNFTLSFWLRANETNRGQTIFSTVNSTQQIYISQNVLYYYADNNNLVGIGINTSNWYHYIVSYQASNRTTMVYVNGNLLNTRIASNTITLSPTLLFGHNGQTAATNAAIFNGTIDDIKIYNRNLTQSEITQLYNE